MPDPPALRVVDPCLLHVPYKNWSEDQKEKANYDEIERWSYRVEKCGARGEIAYAETSTALNYNDTGVVHSFLSIPQVHFVGGRKYKITGVWAGLESSSVGDQFEMLLYVGATLFRNAFFTFAVAGYLSFGGGMVGRYLPQHDQTINVNLASQGAQPTFASATKTVYANTNQSVGQLIVEDIGPQGMF